MKVNVADLEKTIKWFKENTHAVSVDVKLEHNRWLKLTSEDKYQRVVEVTVYSVDKNQDSLLKPTIKKTEQL